MTLESILPFLLLGVIGVASGLVIAWWLRRSRRPFLWTFLACFPGATVAALGVLFVSLIVIGLCTGQSLGRGVEAGSLAVYFFVYLVVFPSGGPAALAGLVFQCVLQRKLRRSRLENPPPRLAVKR